MKSLLFALSVLTLTALAEWVHHRRVRVAGRLAFGPKGTPARWTILASILRPFALAAFAWGLATMFLLRFDVAEGKAASDKEATHLIFVADLSPSMYLKDAGPEGKDSRYQRMSAVVEGILNRVSGNLRFGVIGFYTDALPVVMGARDPELVRNVFNGLPLGYGMKPGKTDLGTAVNAAVKLVDKLPEGSARLVILTDGDSIPLLPILPRPKSVKEVFILGVGNPHKGMFIDGHQSRQDGDTLREIASALHGTYDDVNEKHLATSALGDLVVMAPLPQNGLSLATLAVAALLAGAAFCALLPVALEFGGTAWKVAHPRPNSVPKPGSDPAVR
ncbi:MAG: vWA domain-containing protein [Verrucomicrobiota bacterium]